jgi:putative oxidoreductase
MTQFLGRYSESAYALMRIIVGLLFACHGAQKLLGLFGAEKTHPIASLMGMGGLIELVGGLLMAVGLFTGYAAFVSSGMMAVAYFMAHAPNGFWPIQNRGELAVVYSFLFLYIASRGSGRYSVDSARRA